MFRTTWLAALVLLGWTTARAADAQFDRSSEVTEIIALMRAADRADATAIAHRIYWSGISDRELAAVVNGRLVRDYPTLSLENRRGAVYPDDQYGRSMARALSSFGLPEFKTTLETMAKDPDEGGCPLRKVRNEAARSARAIDWHAKKNAAMASSANHHPGDEEHISRLVNLLLEEDPTLKFFALERIGEGRLTHPRLYATMSEQLAGFISDPSIVDNQAVETYVYLIKMLRATGDAGYAPLMERVAAAQTDQRIKRHAQAAFLRLTQPKPVPTP